MSDLLDLYKFYGAKFPEGLKTSQDAQANAIALDNARRAQQERMDLKALYAQQVQPSMAQLGAVSPEYAQAARKNELEMQKDIVGMQHQQAQTSDIERKANEENEKIRLGQAVAIVNQYDQDIESGMPDAQALAKYNDASGRALSMLKQRGLIPPDFPAFDPKVMNPEAVRLAGEGRNFYTEKAKQRQEYEKSLQGASGTYAAGLAPQKAQYNSVTERWEYPPAPELTNAPAPSRELQVPPGAVDPMEAYEKLVNDPNIPENVRAFAAEQAQTLMPKINAAQEALTPNQKIEMKIQQKGEIAGAEKAANLTAEEKQASKLSIDNYFRSKPPQQVLGLIKESLAGDIDEGVARIGQVFGIATPGASATEVLKVVTQQLAMSSPYPPGSQSDAEFKARLLSIGDPGAVTPIESRLRALEEVYRNVESFVVQKGDLSQDQILDAIANGYLSESSALEMLNKGKKTSTGVQ
jgi:hypothetical protein